MAIERKKLARVGIRRLDLKKTLFVLPNLITLSSIFCGFDSIRISARAETADDYYRAALLLVFAMFFDMLDGRVARMTKTQSAFGLQIDSLADVVSFGVAPSLLVYNWSLHSLGNAGLFIAFLFTAAGAVRLARFNVLSMNEAGQPAKPSKYIVGLPIPGAAGILISIVVANHAASTNLGAPRHAWMIAGVTLALGFFMVSTIKFRSFKEIKLNARTLAFVALIIGSSIVVSMKSGPAFVLVWLLGCYIMMGISETTFHLVRRFTRPQRDSIPPS